MISTYSAGVTDNLGICALHSLDIWFRFLHLVGDAVLPLSASAGSILTVWPLDGGAALRFVHATRNGGSLRSINEGKAGPIRDAAVNRMVHQMGYLRETQSRSQTDVQST